jgi:hypothetical protein
MPVSSLMHFKLLIRALQHGATVREVAGASRRNEAPESTQPPRGMSASNLLGG